MEYLSTVLANKKLAEEIYGITLDFPDPKKFAPGHFVTLSPIEGSVVPRPFAVISTTTNLFENSISVMIQVRGKNTKFYSKMKVGHKIKISGPKGNPIKIEKRPYLLVAGGYGLAGIFHLAEILESKKIRYKILYGTKEKRRTIRYKDSRKVSTVIEEDGRGMVTDLLNKKLLKGWRDSMIIACGPIAMLKETANVAKELNRSCQVIMEEIMACGGNGCCKSCAVFMKDKTVCYACEDGPTFNADEIDWEKISPKLPALSVDAKKNQNTVVGPPIVFLNRKDREPLILNSPILNASGCLDVKVALKERTDMSCYGALITKGIGLDMRLGNDCPRVCEVPGGMINSIGLAGKGVDYLIKKDLPQWQKANSKVFVNIAGKTIEEFTQIAKKLAGKNITGVEINVSCPNVAQGGMLFGVSDMQTAIIVRNVREVIGDKYIIVKLSPMAGSKIVNIARSAVMAGADAISAVNTFPAMDVDIKTHRSTLGSPTGTGGLSGPIILPQSLYFVKLLAEADLGVPIFGVGGISSGVDALKMLIAGASAIQIGTSTFYNKNIALEIYNYLFDAMKERGISNINDLVGSLK